MKKITFIIPCYNCEQFIIRSHQKLKKILSSNQIPYKIYYVNDGSDDLTLKKLNTLNNDKIKIINNKFNLGKSASIIRALKKVKNNYVVLLDCDMPYLSYLMKLIKMMRTNDMVIINRRALGSRNLNSNNFYQIIRKILGKIIGIIIELRFKLNVDGDTQSGLKGFRYIDDLKKTKFVSKYYFLDVELIKLFREKSLAIKSIPVKYDVPKKSTIKIFSLNNIQVILELLRVLFKN